VQAGDGLSGPHRRLLGRVGAQLCDGVSGQVDAAVAPEVVGLRAEDTVPEGRGFA
jgi:hypothetical protein